MIPEKQKIMKVSKVGNCTWPCFLLEDIHYFNILENLFTILLMQYSDAYVS